jgi:nitrate/nitrite-specific signal transduction histidine kinase
LGRSLFICNHKSRLRNEALILNTKYIKYLIILIPSFVIGFWEYFRHEYLLFVITMEQGNWLAPLIVLIATWLLATPLFRRLENTQNELVKVSKKKIKLEVRENIARELHDEIAQSVFLLSVKLDKLEREEGVTETSQALRKTVHQMNEYVRDSIANLRTDVIENTEPVMDSIQSIIQSFKDETGASVDFVWNLNERVLSYKEQALVLSIIREGLFNVRKHSNATSVRIRGNHYGEAWKIEVEDNGTVFEQELHSDQFGIKMLEERCSELNCKLNISHQAAMTKLVVTKGQHL